jgi:hypothetical protein
LKKRTKKLFPDCGVASPRTIVESLFASFSSEKEDFLPSLAFSPAPCHHRASSTRTKAMSDSDIIKFEVARR